MKIAGVVASQQGGEAYDRNIINKHHIHIFLCINRNYYRCLCRNNSIHVNFEQRRINQ